MNDKFDDCEYITKKRPHVVILGAGASCAAIPNGDKFGNKISAMNGFIDKLGLNEIITNISLKTNSDNLEDIYMELDERSKQEPVCHEIKEKLEQAIYDYMSKYQLPDNPTIYDFLVLSLTSKDLIATFNWDPLLVQSIVRMQRYTTNLPTLAFLHGNVAVGYCDKCNIMGNVGQLCKKCTKNLQGIKLLYPIKHKDYSSNIGIEKSWKTLNNALEVAYMITIFGYSAPKSDIEALAMMKKAWGQVEDRSLEQIEIIDIREEKEVIESWHEFIHTHHYSYYTDFFDSALAQFPRRTCEAMFDQFMKCKFLDSEKGFKSNMNYDDIHAITHKLIEEEEQLLQEKKVILSNPYI